jgi:hypothetical protein
MMPMLVVRLSKLIIQRVTRKKKISMSSKVIPFLVELSDKNNISMEHIHSMCTLIMETEAATMAMQMVLVFCSLGKYRPKSKGKR